MSKKMPQGYLSLLSTSPSTPITYDSLLHFSTVTHPGLDNKHRSSSRYFKDLLLMSSSPGKQTSTYLLPSFPNWVSQTEPWSSLLPLPLTYSLNTNYYLLWDAVDEWTKWRQSVSGTALDNGWYRHAVRLAARYQWYTLTGTENWHPKKEDKTLKQLSTPLVEETTVPQEKGEEEEPIISDEEEVTEHVSGAVVSSFSLEEGVTHPPLVEETTEPQEEETGVEVNSGLTLTAEEREVEEILEETQGAELPYEEEKVVEAIPDDTPPDPISLYSITTSKHNTHPLTTQPKKKYTHVKDHIRNTNREEVESLFPFLSSFPYEDGDILVREAPFGGHSFDAAVYSPSRNEAWIVEGKCKEVHHGAGQLLFYKHLATSLWKEWKEATRTHLVLTLPCRPKECYLPFLSDHTIEVWWKE